MNNLNKQNLSDREKRVAPRFQVDLKAPVIITVVSFDDEGTESYFVMRGRLLNVSRTGLALIISNKDIQEFYKLKGNLVFRLLLPLPVEAIELEVIPVRHQQQLNSAGIEEKLIGAHITNMNGRHRVIFMEFINQFEFTESAAPQIIEIAKQNDFNQNEIVGMNFYSAFVRAKQHGCLLRIVRKNGNDCLVARDYYPNRINVAVQKDIITKIMGFN